jgi:hypothetical protein
LDENFQKKREENYQKNIEREILEKEIEREQSENKLLKRAISIQNQQKEEFQQENNHRDV